MRTAVVVPVRHESDLLQGCLEALAAQEQPPDEVIVVDDHVTPSVVLPPPTRVLHSGGVGPYGARNLGARASDADVVLFLDVRSRPAPTWLHCLATAFDDPAVALAGSDVRVRHGRGLGALAAHAQQSFLTTYYVEQPFFRPYLPTCNLAVRRSDLEAVDGFSEVRSGADADFCWRVLDRPGRRLAVVPGELMEWVPRESMWDYLRQNHRYGKSNHALRAAWGEAGAPARAPLPAHVIARRVLRTAVNLAVASGLGRRDLTVDLVRHAAGLANELGYATAARRPVDVQMADCCRVISVTSR